MWRRVLLLLRMISDCPPPLTVVDVCFLVRSPRRPCLRSSFAPSFLWTRVVKSGKQKRGETSREAKQSSVGVLGGGGCWGGGESQSMWSSPTMKA